MRSTDLVMAFAAVIVLAMGCGRAAENSDREQWAPAMDHRVEAGNGEAAADEPPSVSSPADPKEALSSSAARAIGDTTRRFIHTADLRFRTKDAVQSTFAIEVLVARFDGYVASTRLVTEVDHRYTTPISADSLLETTKFTITNRLTIRIPNANLDTTLKSLIRFVDFLDHRTITATDVRLMLLGNRLAQDRVSEHKQRLTDAIDEQGRKLKETVSAEERLLDRQEQADDAKLRNLELQDRIAYSTITLDLYQRQDIRREMLPNEQNIERYEPGFFEQAGDALKDGWELLVQFALFLVRSWSVILILGLGYIGFRHLMRKGK
ncbi:MAG TPA: DUF4349 domain-containing protein [Flavobacteriales bacterium]|nr:DUF4349 domain-containing protein [Flavobacteriales bacterium]